MTVGLTTVGFLVVAFTVITMGAFAAALVTPAKMEAPQMNTN